jgi:hypothetical protein
MRPEDKSSRALAIHEGARRDLFQGEPGRLDGDRPVCIRQPQKGSVAPRDHVAALRFLEGREGEIEMEQREQLQRTCVAATSCRANGAFIS